MDDRISLVLDAYHERMDEERNSPREEAPGGRDGGQDQRMRAVGPNTGRLLNILARSLEAPTILELGTSFGYSGIWLAEAARATGGRLITMELHGYKSAYARDMAEKAGLAGHVDFRVGDAVAMIGDLAGKVDFVLVDLWKDLYLPCLEAFYPKLNPGAIVVADNMIRPGNEDIRRYGRAVRALPGMTSVLLPVGSGIEVSRYEPNGAY
ncbi:O-methyltransferase [Kaistia nematophila]|uniref:Class I SAM-dependent methyltransferase n=1 Tax=Kaistia nematophila TaxID=2994654 RepID=A0A9X3E377_9HYPH|nr:class I SAM-dependent methyltransferase [Kaistia nematophila]MCX5570263.1 class I SAM-dependent methyltransferase [Kaistia nematophila]